MKYLFLIMMLLTFASCANMQVINEAYTSKTPDYKKTYSAKPKACLEGVKKSLVEMGAGVSEIKGDRISSERWKFSNYAEATGGAYYASAMSYSLTAKLYINVSEAEQNSCSVQVTKVRVWENTQEFEKLNNDQVLQHLVKPFFNSLNEYMAQ